MKIRIHLKIFIFVLIFILTKQIKIYGILMLFAFLHEIGHMIAGLLLGFKPYNIEIMPVGLSVTFSSNEKNYNTKIKKGMLINIKKAIIALAGPITNIIFIILFLTFDFGNMNKELIIYSNILIAIFNLIPIYPLDGGRMMKEILCILCGRRKASRYVNTISNACIIIITAISSIAILYLRNIAVIIILVYLWYLVISENRKMRNKEKIYDRLKDIEI